MTTDFYRVLTAMSHCSRLVPHPLGGQTQVVYDERDPQRRCSSSVCANIVSELLGTPPYCDDAQPVFAPDADSSLTRPNARLGLSVPLEQEAHQFMPERQCDQNPLKAVVDVVQVDLL